MPEGILTIKMDAPTGDALLATARFAVHVSGHRGSLRWGANGVLNQFEDIGPDDHQPETPQDSPVGQPAPQPVAVVAEPVAVQQQPKRTRKPAAKKAKK